MLTATEIKKMIIDRGADLCGIASIDRFENAPKGFHPKDVLPSCKSVIVFANKFYTEHYHVSRQCPIQ